MADMAQKPLRIRAAALQKLEAMNPVKLFCGLAFLVFGCASALALEGMLGVHDPSTVIICDGNYYVYATGRGVSAMTSTNGFNWQRGTRVFDRVPDSVRQYCPKNDGAGVWAPDVIKLNGEYYLYYSISSWGQFVSAVGLMTSHARSEESKLQMDGSRHGRPFQRGRKFERD